MISESPEEPHLRSEPNLLSPASPKPIHFPAPTNIPVLEMQMDVGFNQTEAHMNDPAMHNTDIRPDVWRDPQEVEASTTTTATGNHTSLNSAEEAAQVAQEASSGANTLVATSGDSTMTEVTDSNVDAAIDPAQAVTLPLSPSSTNDIVPDQTQPAEYLAIPADPSNPLAEDTTLSQAPSPAYANQDDDTQGQPFSSAVNVEAFLNNLNPASAATSDGGPSNVLATPSVDTLSALIQPPLAQRDSEKYTNGEISLSSAAGDVSFDPSQSALSVASSGLPPRPPPQEQPLMNPNYAHSQHIRDYHPHAVNPAFHPQAHSGTQSNTVDPNSNPHALSVTSPSSVVPATAATDHPAQPDSTEFTGPAAIQSSTQPTLGGQTAQSNGGSVTSYSPFTSNTQHDPYTGSPQNMYGIQYPSDPGTSTDSRRERTVREGEQSRPEDRPWDAEVQRKYDRFIEEERKYVSEGRWEQFPQGSRLFVGNLSSEKVTKRDIFHVFHTYGELAQISIKQAYGFVQFLRTEDCMKALHTEEGTQIRDKKIHLEVSKPQKNRTQNHQRRSRSPPDGGRARPGSNVDRYVSGSRGGSNRGSYGNHRSPSPRGYRDRHDDRYRRRSRSPDYNRGGRYRSPSPRRDMEDDGLQLPRRAPRDIPDVQIIVLDTLDRDFISWVEQAFANQGIRVDVLRLSPRLSEQAVVRRQIIEGVVGVVKLRRQNQDTSKIGLQIFDRSQGVNNVKFEQYEGLDPGVVVQLVQRAKQTHAPSHVPYGSGYPPAPSYNAAPSMPPAAPYAPYGAPTGPYPPQHQQHPGGYQSSYTHGPPPPGSVPPNLQNLITNLEPNHLQSLLSAMSTPQSGHAMSAYSATPQGLGSQPTSAVAPLQAHPGLAGYLQQQQPQPQQQMHAPARPPGSAGSGGAGAANGQVMQDILARLGTGPR